MSHTPCIFIDMYSSTLACYLKKNNGENDSVKASAAAVARSFARNAGLNRNHVDLSIRQRVPLSGSFNAPIQVNVDIITHSHVSQRPPLPCVGRDGLPVPEWKDQIVSITL